MVAGTRESDGRVVEAIRFALEAHRRQTRKDGRTPYIVHPVAVMRHLASDLGVEDADLLCAAVLHDVIEDTGVSRDDLERRFGRRVAGWVQELTIPEGLHGPAVPDERKTAAIVHDVGRISWEAILLKLCDRWDNTRDMANALWGEEKRASYRAQTREILRAVDRRAATDAPPSALVAFLKKARVGLDA